MKFKKTKTAALLLAAAFACGSLSGCALVTTDIRKDLNQVVAEVNITNSETFKGNGEYASYANSIERSDVYKRELVANYATYGSTYVNSYGYTVEQAYELIKSNLVNRQIYLQYAQAYFFANGIDVKDENGNVTHVDYSVAEYNQAKASAEEKDKDIAGLRYFLDKEEIAEVEYTVKTSVNAMLDSQETSIIEAEEDLHDHDTARTTPTGVNTTVEDYYDPAYDIYTGSNSAANCGSYETVDGSTPATRKRAYKAVLSNLNYYGLVAKGENTSDFTSLTYYNLQRRTQYETAVINKLTDSFEEEASKAITEQWLRQNKLEPTLAVQKRLFSGTDASALETALDSVSDSSYVLYAPAGYGFVINILLPFSTWQTQDLNDSPADLGDKLGNKFARRASLLRDLTATDQRNTWFTGHDDFSYEVTDGDRAYTANDSDRKYLFFENNFKKSVSAEGVPAQYETIKNYFGAYTYNGSVFATEDEDGDTKYTFRPNKLTIDDFLTEMESYLNFAGLHLGDVPGKLRYPNGEGDGYYSRKASEYYKDDGTVDYSTFLYYEAKIEELADFDANVVFLGGENQSDENLAMSVINELSFAYNTDTAGLNSYLGYTVSPNSTDFVKEFEFAAQEAVRGGAGTITVAPSDYGWHIMYCTFAYTADSTSPYEFNWDDIEVEGTFSNLYYNALKANNFSSFSSERQTSILNIYDNDDCVVLYENRYKDLYEA